MADRAAFEWALASAAVALESDGGEIHQARIVVGGVATEPWRLRHVASALICRQINADAIRAAAARAAMVLNPCGQKLFKVELIKRVVERALQIPREAKHGRRDRKAYRPRRWAIKSYRHGDKIINAENALSITTKSALVGIKARERM